MSLLREIQDAAIDADTGIATLLRKCKVLAARIGSNEFKEWVDRELSGYISIDDLPGYRQTKVFSLGHLSGAFGAAMRNADIPSSCIPEEHRKHVTHCYLMEPAEAIEALVSDTEGNAQEPWDPNLVALVSRNIYANHALMQAWKVIPRTFLVTAVGEIRNRILSFVLEVEAAAPDAGEAATNSNPVPQEALTKIFNTYFTGNVQNVATGSSDFVQDATVNNTSTKVFDSLVAALNDLKEPAVTNSIVEQVEAMRLCQGQPSFLDRYKEFISSALAHSQVAAVLLPLLPALAALIP